MILSIFLILTKTLNIKNSDIWLSPHAGSWCGLAPVSVLFVKKDGLYPNMYDSRMLAANAAEHTVLSSTRD